MRENETLKQNHCLLYASIIVIESLKKPNTNAATCEHPIYQPQ